MAPVLFYASLAGAGLSLVVHVFACFGVVLPGSISLHWLCMLVAFCSAVVARRMLRKLPGSRFGRSFRPIIAALPRWMRWSLLSLVLYAWGTGMLGLAGESGSPVEREGRYFLATRGRASREISREEFDAANARSFRAASGIWMSFFSISAAVFLVRDAWDPRRRPAADARVSGEVQAAERK